MPAELDQYCKFIHPCIIFSHKTREMTTAVSRKLVLNATTVQLKHRTEGSKNRGRIFQRNVGLE